MVLCELRGVYSSIQTRLIYIFISQMYDYCAGKSIGRFVLTSYDNWIFGNFSLGMDTRI